MAGAVPLTGMGAGYVVPANSPRVHVRECMGRYQVTLREGGTWAEIVAETKTLDMAQAVAQRLRQQK